MNTTNQVEVREETVSIPTYRTGEPEKAPMFLEKRVYQGSSGVVYPHPIISRVFDEKYDRNYTAVFLENRYLRIMLLPELGGRVQMALDKTNGYHFIYYNQVIKPALVGLTGPWLSGGIEFNWPQHHRPSTFEPVDYRIDDNLDGSKTVWFSEIEQMFHTKGMAGFTLYPDRAYLEIQVQLYNRTELPQTFLWWANPAVHVNDDYQTVFPPDVYAVMDHGKRDVSTFPIATGTYYKVDYAPGTDISRYKNIPVPTSYMAYHSDFDFLGCYDHGKQAGMLHVANHHTVPGKKQWTWGNGDFGRAWDRQLTDSDGPYIELMCGAYTDNQPDFSWLQPGEEKRFTQVFMPFKQIGAPKNASREAALNLELVDNGVKIGVYVSWPRTVRVELAAGEHTLYRRELALSPEQSLIETIPLDEPVSPPTLRLSVWDGSRQILAFSPLPAREQKIPAPMTAARPPSEIPSNEELFLNGLHLEQYRHATYEPEPYYQEALRRDPFDSRCNNALGLLLLRRGKFAEAEPYFRKATERLTRRNPNPYDGEPFYNLGLALKMQGRYDEAFDVFYKSVWNAAWQDSGYFELARLASRRGDWGDAFQLAEASLARNYRHHKARHLKIAILRHLDRLEEAADEAAQSLRFDRLDFGAMVEQFYLSGAADFQFFMRDRVQSYIEIALDYLHAGLFDEAVRLLDFAPLTDPTVKYYQGWAYWQAGNTETADDCFSQARQMPPDFCFPNSVECVLAFGAALARDGNDARASYYLGNFWYAHRRYQEAIRCWEHSRDVDPTFPTLHRNLGLAYMNKQHNAAAALAAYEQAVTLAPTDTCLLFELDQLYKKTRRRPAERLARLEHTPDLIDQRDDLTVEYVTLLNLIGRHDEALKIILAHTFYPWEGGEGKVTGQYITSLMEIAKNHLAAGAYDAAAKSLRRALDYPPNLGEGKLVGVHDNHIYYFLGLAALGLGNKRQALECFQRAATGMLEPTSPLYYNDRPPEMLLYQGLAQRQLGHEDEACAIFHRLVTYGNTHLNDPASFDYFAVSLPDFLVFEQDLQQQHRTHCLYMIALGLLGLGKQAEAEQHLDWILQQEPDHLGAVVHRKLLNSAFTQAK